MFIIAYTSKTGVDYFFDAKGKTFSKKQSVATTYVTAIEAESTIASLPYIKLPKTHRGKQYRVVSLDTEIDTSELNEIDVPELDEIYIALKVIQRLLSCKTKLSEIRNSMDLEQNSVLHSLENTDYTEEQLIEIFQAFKLFRKRRRKVKDLLALINTLTCRNEVSKAIGEIDHIKARKPEDFSGYDKDVEKFLYTYSSKKPDLDLLLLEETVGL